jgi:predicted DNA-binding transcriptional regulator AlpA
MRAKAWTSAQVAEWQRQQLAAAGQDTSAVKDEPLRFLRLSEVCKRIGLSKPSVYRRIADGRFPRPISLS